MKNLRMDSALGKFVGSLLATCMVLQPFFIDAMAKSAWAAPENKGVPSNDGDDPPPTPKPQPIPKSAGLEFLQRIVTGKDLNPEQPSTSISHSNLDNQSTNMGSGVGKSGPSNQTQAKSGCCATGGDPVELTTGEFVHTETDLYIPARGFPIEIKRTYRSRQQYPGPMGYNWFFFYESRIDKTVAGNYAVLELGGRREEYVKNGAVWNAPERHYDTLTEEQDGTVKITKKDGSFIQYDLDGRLSKLQDRFGNFLTFEYDAAGKFPLVGNSGFFHTQTSGVMAMVYRLKTIKDSYGRGVTLDYYGTEDGFKSGRIKSCTDYIGRTIVYDYDDKGDLISVRSPVTEDYPAGKSTTYAYYNTSSDINLKHNLKSITDAKQQQFLFNVYDASDRVSTQTFGQENFVFAYNDTWPSGYHKIVTLTDRNGNETVNEINEGGQITKVTQKTNRNIRPGEPDYITEWTYNSQNEVLTVKYPRGNGVKYAYDNAGNPTSVRVKASMAAADDDNLDLITRYEYEPRFNSLKRTVDPSGFVRVNYFDYEEAHKLLPPAQGSAMWVYDAGQAGLGDLNEDGLTNQDKGLVVATRFLGANDGADDQNAANDGVTIGQPALQTILATFAYNDFGQIVSAKDPIGNRTDFAYHPANDPDGDGQNLIPNAGTAPNGYLKQVVSGAGTLNITTQYKYDGVGNVIQVTDPRGNTTTYAVNSLNQVVGIVSPLVTLHDGTANPQTTAYATEIEYDANDNVARVRIENRDEDGNLVAGHNWIETIFTYDNLDNLTLIEEETGPGQTRTTQFTYDANENLIKIEKPEENVVLYEYDERDLLYRVIRDLDGAGAVSADDTISVANYDPNGNLSTVVRPPINAGAATIANSTTAFEYDGFDRMQRLIDALGNKAVSSFDKNSNVLSVEFQDPADAVKARRVAVYDELNRAVERRSWIAGDTAVLANYVKSTTLFDKNSRVKEYTDDNGRKAYLVYDEVSRVKEVRDHLGNKVEFAFDANSNLLERLTTELHPDIPQGQTFKVAGVYDELNRLVKSINQGADGTFGNGDDLSSLVRYDSRGNVTTSVDPKNTVTKVLYDALNRRTQVQLDPTGLNITSKCTYDDNSRLVSYSGIRDNADDPADYHTTGYQYDNLDRLVQVTYADGAIVGYEYDLAGNTIELTDQNGSVASYTYDALERLVTTDIVAAGGVLGVTQRAFVYDALSRLTRATDNNDPNTTADDTACEYTYDGLSRALTERQLYGPAGTETVDKTVTSDFHNTAPATPDRLNLNKVAYPDGTIVRYGRDELDRVTQIFHGDNTTNKLAEFTYAGFGRTLKREHFTGTAAPSALSRMEVSFDGLKRVTGVLNKFSNGTDIAGFVYGYDKASNRALAKHVHKNNEGEVYRFDAGYRVTEAYYGTSAGDMATAEATLAAGGDPAAPTTFTKSVAYTLDDLDNRTQVDDGGTVTAYASDNANGATQYEMNRYSAVGGTAQVHDANGNLTDDGTHLYAYDFYNRLLRVTRKADSQVLAEYRYDPSSRRVRKTVTNSGSLNGTTHYVHDGAMVIEEHAVANPGAGETLAQTARYLNGRGIDERIAMERADVADVDNDADTGEFQRFYYHTDVLNSVRAVTYLDGTTERLVERVEYDIYGKQTLTNWGDDRVFGTADDVTSTTSLVGNPYLFTGREFDAESGLYNYRLRYYQPATGRFISQDPAGYVDGANLYGYVMGNPVGYTDPWGLAKAEKGASRPTFPEKLRAPNKTTHFSSER